MKQTLLIFLLFSLISLPQSLFANGSAPEYEMLVIENLPEDLSLDMSVKELVRAKYNSNLQKDKQRVYEILVNHLSPLLSGSAFAQGYNLVELAAKVPLQKIVDDLIATDSNHDSPSDFMILVLPKKPTSLVNKFADLPYAPLYSSKKASVISQTRNSDALRNSFSDLINNRLQEAISYVYQSQLAKENRPATFFVGALAHIHIEQGATEVKLQLIGGLPTDQAMDFEQKEVEVHLRSFNYPKTAEPKLFTKKLSSHPGAIVELKYKEDRAAPVMARIKFGSLGLIQGTDWLPSDALKPFDQITLGTEGFAISQFSHSYNVPHIKGEVLKPLGNGIIDWEFRGNSYKLRPPTLQNLVNSWLARDYDIQMNVHEVEVDVQQMTITDMRITLQLNIKDHIWFGALPMPTIELPAINEKFRVAGNEKLEPARKELEFVKSMNLVNLLKDPKTQMELFFHINQLLSNGGGL